MKRLIYWRFLHEKWRIKKEKRVQISLSPYVHFPFLTIFYLRSVNRSTKLWKSKITEKKIWFFMVAFVDHSLCLFENRKVKIQSDWFDILFGFVFVRTQIFYLSKLLVCRSDVLQGESYGFQLKCGPNLIKI